MSEPTDAVAWPDEADPSRVAAGASALACTVVAGNYLPAARVLARSYLEHHPDHEFVIAVIDAPRDAPRDEEGYRIVGPEAFGIDETDYLRMATAYSVTELATAVKPYLLRRLRAQADVVIYLDPDMRVFAPMAELVDLAVEHQIVLVPHFLNPLPRDGREPDEAVIMGTGIFNLGFIAVGPGAEDFLDFWADRLRQDAIVAPEQQLFTDQRWVDQVPALFPHTVLRDPGYDVAYWNVHERPIDRAEDGTVTAGGVPLRFFHFSGYRPEKPWLLSYHCARKPRVLLSEHPELRRICDEYGRALQDAGYRRSLDDIPYGFNALADGTKLTPRMRRLYRDAWVRAEKAIAERAGSERPGRGEDEQIPPPAFGPDRGAAFRAWLTSPSTQAQASAGLNRLVMSVWDSRVDLRMAFPQPCGADAENFRHWCRNSGPAEGMLPEWALPVEPEADLRDPEDTFGVNILGYLTAELGLGEMGRIVHDAIQQAGVPVVSVVEEKSLSNRTGVDRPDTVGRPRFPVSLLAVNADQTQVVLDNHPEVGHHRYRIGLWAWELEDFPEWLHNAFGLVDEVWTVSEFCRTAIARHSSVPVKTIPVPVRDPGEHEPPSREPGQPVQFLFAFDFNSVGQRKNPWGAVTAFQRAFPDRDDVRLVIKAINGRLHPHAAERLRVLVADDPRIELLEHYLSAAELHELYARSSCYVSLHRSEGFGLTVAEAMARAMPVISTNYSSTTEFLDHTTGWPVPYRMTPVGEGNDPYHKGAVWADPDLDAAARAMREVADNPVEAARRGRAARRHILRTRPMTIAAEWMREQLEAAYQTWRQRQAGAAASPADTDPLRPLRHSREALRWRPEVEASSRTPLAPALRRAVLRVIDHYDVHQRKVMGTLVDGVEGTLGQLVARLESVEAALGEAQSAATRSRRFATDLAALRETVDELCHQAPGTELALRNLERDVADLRVSVHDVHGEQAALAARLDGKLDSLLARLESGEKKTFEMFVERDRRSDADEHTLQQVKRDVIAVHEAARLRHAPVPADAEVVVCDAGTLLLPRDNVVAPWLAYHRSWETSEADLMAELMAGRSGTFLDVGAHVGYHTLKLFQACPRVDRVVAVEANPVNAGFLRRNLAVNLDAASAGRVTVLALAAWDSDGEVRLVQEEADNSGDHRVHAQVGDTAAAAGVAVPAVRLDGLAEVTAQPVGLVKIDLQGRDHRALAGLAGVLDRDHPDVVCEFCPEAIEELGDDPAQVLARYREFGYVPMLLTEDGPARGRYTDNKLIQLARKAETGFVTLWLKPTG
ncbi:FkbM family methyltransferase [Goodfellowiella coeruleoviolacea]|uniref:Methyltransferase, FkbM family n=1 Tax=Goodfellowiella coeruleoviolacea TaxID=334858 RepID=A0AAE3GIY7_9PSEU|nr:FkbM family methyltransferase [Goodfellowiella coeruleoviolacea]MCP2169061.1 methyltransferase, FkbM family [Goodfellowiella coeruleoviolacea]